MKFSPSSCYLLLPGPQISPQHIVLKHHESIYDPLSRHQLSNFQKLNHYLCTDGDQVFKVLTYITVTVSCHPSNWSRMSSIECKSTVTKLPQNTYGQKCSKFSPTRHFPASSVEICTNMPRSSASSILRVQFFLLYSVTELSRFLRLCGIHRWYFSPNPN